MNNLFRKDSAGDHIWNIVITAIMFLLFSGILGLYLTETFAVAAISAVGILGFRYIMAKALGELLSFNLLRESVTIAIGVIALILVR